MSERQRIRQLEFEAPRVDSVGAIASSTTGHAQIVVEHLGDGLELELVAVPGGAFMMGSQPSTVYDDERPRHRATVEPFLLGRHEVTQEQWTAVMGSNPSRFRGARRPVDNVSREDAMEFCDRLARSTGHSYRLPSEAEWEYACRAGTTTAFSCGVTLTTDLANYNGQFAFDQGPKGVYRHTTTEVGSFPPNALGLYDMHGNLWEWCADSWHDNYVGAPLDGRAWAAAKDLSFGVLRGGSWHDGPDVCRCSVRLKGNRGEGDDFFGFRVAAALLSDLRDVLDPSSRGANHTPTGEVDNG